MGRWWHWPIITTTTSGTSNSSNNYRSFFEQWPWSLEWSRLCRRRWIRIEENGGSPSESTKRYVNKTRWTWNLHWRFETSTQCGACRRTLEWRRWTPENNLDVAGPHQQSRYEKSRNKEQSFPKDRRFFQDDGKSRRTTWHEQCDHSQVQKFRRCLPFQDMTAHCGQTAVICLDSREREPLPVTLMLTWKPNTLQQFQWELQQSTIQDVCRTAKGAICKTPRSRSFEA